MSHPSFSQTTTVSGTVINAGDNTPVAGVSVVQRGAANGTATDQKGFFNLNVSGSKPVLEFSNVGYQPYTLSWDGSSAIVIRLEREVSALQDVVVVGYSTQKKVNLTGAVQTIKFDDAVNQPVTNSAQLMYGKFSGVQLTQGNGLPGSDNSSILIRGQGTFGNSTPLVVIDNIQYNGLTEFNNLSPTDIETITVLKDASASAIYGARGANGVVLVTTKKGKKGKVSLDYNNYFGLQRVTVVPEYLDGLNYALLYNEKLKNQTPANPVERYRPSDIEAIRTGSAPDRFANTNWADEILRDAPIQQHYLAFSGGSENSSFRVSAGYLTQVGVLPALIDPLWDTSNLVPERQPVVRAPGVVDDDDGLVELGGGGAVS